MVPRWLSSSGSSTCDKVFRPYHEKKMLFRTIITCWPYAPPNELCISISTPRPPDHHPLPRLSVVVGPRSWSREGGMSALIREDSLTNPHPSRPHAVFAPHIDLIINDTREGAGERRSTASRSTSGARSRVNVSDPPLRKTSTYTLHSVFQPRITELERHCPCCCVLFIDANEFSLSFRFFHSAIYIVAVNSAGPWSC